MTEAYEIVVELSDDDAEAVDEFPDDRVKSTVQDALEELASAEDKRQELRRRRGADESSKDNEELSGEELEEALREFMRGDRERDPRL